MKITDIRTLCLSRPHEPEREWFSDAFRSYKADCPIVIIETDAGIQGISEPSSYGVPPRIRERVEAMKPDFLGRDPLEPGLVPANSGDQEQDIVNAGIELALWDIRGKVEDKSVAALLISQLGGDPHERIRLYASAGVRYDWDHNPESVIDEAEDCVNQGFTAFKMRLGTHWGWSGVTVPRFLELLRRMTDRVGDRLELMLEGNCRFDEEQALAVGRALDEMGWTWLEEPLPKDQVDGYARLNAALDLPITGGESNSLLADFEPFFAKKAYSIAQLDVGITTMSQAIEIVHRAEECGVTVCPQNWHNGLLTMSNAHLVAALPNPTVLEVNISQGPLQWDILTQCPLRDGYLEMPQKPGWGVELADDIEGRFPYIEGPWGVAVER